MGRSGKGLRTGLPGQASLGSGVCAAAFTHFLLVPGQGGWSYVGGLADARVPGIGGEGGGGVYGGEKHVSQLWISHCCVLCDHFMSLDEGQILPGANGIL